MYARLLLKARIVIPQRRYSCRLSTGYDISAASLGDALKVAIFTVLPIFMRLP
jgi:hypothetical protein